MFAVKENIQFHTFTITTEKILIVVLKGLIKLNKKTILSNLKTQGLKPLNYTELPTHTKYPIYSYLRAKYNSRKNKPGQFHRKHQDILGKVRVPKTLDTMLPLPGPCNKNAVCVKCAKPHNTKECTKFLDVSPTDTNCRGNHTANYSKYFALLAYLAKKSRNVTKKVTTFCDGCKENPLPPLSKLRKIPISAGDNGALSPSTGKWTSRPPLPRHRTIVRPLRARWTSGLMRNI
ncbi:hypothetical protein WN51_13343 [Melipona quadrifasciata]|uniref:Pre-C2HC domain-containing protein n=1 Tax=Melipona quadrifasciata TaxID=166423 RepID=A0A0M9A4T4_9HYME|nr:hypothetical protein WN51_13343 [Melipona quadrifasciata]